MTSEEIIRMAREAAARHGHTLKEQPAPETVEFITELAAMAAAAEREACIAAIQAQIDHAHLNELRLTPRFGKRHGEIAVRADDLEATLDGIRTRGKQ